MKRLLLVIVLFVGGLNSFCAGVIPMQIIDPGSMGSSGTYAPPRPWYITQDDHVLTLPTFEDDFTLELRDERRAADDGRHGNNRLQ